MQEYLLGLVRRLGEWDYLLLFLAAALEASAFLGLVIPGETIALLGGFLAYQGVLDIVDTLAVITLGAIVGDSLGYSLGRRVGHGVVLRFGRWLGVGPRRLARVEEFFRARGAWAVVIGRFTGILRAVTPFVAGSSRMPYGRFFVFNVAGGVAWAVLVVFSGYFFGAGWTLAERWLGRLSTAVGAVVLVGVAWLVVRRHHSHEAFGGAEDE